MGLCGKKISCGRDRWTTNCPLHVVQKSQFYFSAENAICKDYITGKTIPWDMFGGRYGLAGTPVQSDALWNGTT